MEAPKDRTEVKEDVEDEDIFSVVLDELSFLFFLLVLMTRHTLLGVAEEDWQNCF